MKLQALFKTLTRCGIHQRFLSSSFGQIEEIEIPQNLQNQYRQIKAYAAHLEENIKAGRGLLLKGAVGTMKTTLAVAVLREYLDHGGEGLFLTMSGLLDNIFTLKAKSMNQWARFEQQIRDTPLLVLDDLGAEHTEGWVLTKVDSIIAERYNRCRSIVITTNLSTAQLRGVYAERVIDRLRSTLEIINFSGPSQRRSPFAE
ncbi:ATP-binding protein [Desulfitobacterium metallireducens]|uniref:ATP-binding protein n=1 Tax=Desulfitobacterium metallireducens TaxID=142877 RepID=UPI0002314B70|nr:ATP-binding protein [Desulfitobacterium metallireducens]